MPSTGSSAATGALPDAITPQRLRHELLAGETACLREEKRYLKQDGSVVFGVVRYSLARDLEGEPLLIVAQIGDRTEQMKAEGEIRPHRERLVEVARLGTLGEMAAGIAHELNQPLTAIGNYAQACQRLIRNDAISNYVQVRIHKAAPNIDIRPHIGWMRVRRKSSPG